MRQRQPRSMAGVIMAFCVGLFAAAFAVNTAVRLIEAVFVPLLIIGGVIAGLAVTATLIRRARASRW